MGDSLEDCSPLVEAAAGGKLRLVRLLVEGGTQVNGHNPSGETPLLAVCKAMTDTTGEETAKLLTYLLHNKADPNTPDRGGRTPLMYACMHRAGPQVVALLLAAGADPSLEDFSGASALVYAINAQHQPTLQLLMDACPAKGRDIILVARETGASGDRAATRRYLTAPLSAQGSPQGSLQGSPVACMSPSDIVLKTGSPSSPETDTYFDFLGTAKRGSSGIRVQSCDQGGEAVGPIWSCDQGGEAVSPAARQRRMLSEPWLDIQNLSRLYWTYEEGVEERRPRDEGGGGGAIGEERGGGGGGEGALGVEQREGGGRMNWGRGKEEKTDVHCSVVGRWRGAASQGERRSKEEPWGSLLSLTEGLRPVSEWSSMSQNQGHGSWGFSSQRIYHRSSIDTITTQRPPRRNTLPSLVPVPPLLHLSPLSNQSDVHLRGSPSQPPCVARGERCRHDDDIPSSRSFVSWAGRDGLVDGR
ncbi:unnamed protein product [Lota lota]